jgi:hypothetical protein
MLALLAVLQAGPARAVAPPPRAERTPSPAVGDPRVTPLTPRLVFEENRGQAGPGAAFVARHSEFTAFLEAHAATFATGDEEPVRMAFRDPAPGCRIAGSSPTGGVTTSFRAGIPAVRARHFAAAATASLRPGVDLRWRDDEGGRLTYDLVVAPGADPSRVEFEVTGALGVRVAADGSLRIETSAGEMTHTRPVVYQESERGRVRVAGEFALRNGSVVGFDVGSYDRTRALVIDPSIEYTARVGGGGTFARAIAADADGAAYVAGRTHSSAFPATSGPLDANGDDVFVAKIAKNWQSVAWAVLIGGSDRDEAVAVAVNSQGEAVVGGDTQSTDFPLAGSLIERGLPNGSYGFVAKLSADGASLLYSTLVGVPDRQSQVSGVALDAQGRAVAVGGIWDGGAFATEGAYVSPGIGGNDVLIAMLAADGSALEWGALLGGGGQDRATGVALGADGAVYVCGSAQLGTFPITADLFPGAGNGDEMFLAKLSADGASLAYSVEFATESMDRANAVAVDGAGAAYLTGLSSSYNPGRRKRSVLPVTGRPIGAPATSPRGSPFVVKVNPAGDALEWSVRVGGRAGEGRAIATDDSGGVVVAGLVGRAGPATVLQRHGPGGESDWFVTRIGRDAKSITYTAILGGDEYDGAEGLVIGPDGRAYVTGTTVGGEPPFDRVLAGSSLDEGAGVVRFAPHNVRLVMRTGMVEAGPGDSDWYVVTGAHGFANVVPDFDPRTRDLVIRFRYGERVESKLIYYNPSRWVRSATGVYFYDARADHSLQVWFTAKSFRILVTHESISTPLRNPFSLEIAFGADRGYDQRAWRRTQSGPRERYQLGD